MTPASIWALANSYAVCMHTASTLFHNSRSFSIAMYACVQPMRSPAITSGRGKAPPIGQSPLSSFLASFIASSAVGRLPCLYGFAGTSFSASFIVLTRGFPYIGALTGSPSYSRWGWQTTKSFQFVAGYDSPLASAIASEINCVSTPAPIASMPKSLHTQTIHSTAFFEFRP